ncbi:adenylate/guanylate cyclase domain-containing protein [Gilvimarinus sp. F26214L]|uniref:adenylate/guanylate cyclase domain-containing protein n=1 Tax=Gilvimarinus sp. DZF01 TaxID=3461371 RepID=UPI004046639A
MICFAAAGTLATDMEWPHINPIAAAVIVLLLGYTWGSYAVTRCIRSEKAEVIAERLTYGDAALVGVVLNLIDFSLLPSILFVTMVQFNALLQGGVRKWAGDNLALLCGVMASLLIHRPSWVFSDNLEISAASLIGITTYFCAYALYTYTRFRKLSMKVEQLKSEQHLHKLRAYKLSRYLPPPVWNAINEGRDRALATERKRLTIFFADIKGFSQMSEELEAETLTELLNSFLTEMTKIATQFGGVVNKFMGDGVMIVFGDNPQSQGAKNDAIRCVSMAIAMKKRMKVLQHDWFKKGIRKPLQIRMGINTGYCTVGTFGTSDHLDYTVLGTHVNLASRLETAADPGEILISYETWSLIKDIVMCRDKGDIQVKGFSQPIQVYQVVDLRKHLGKNQSYFEQNTDGFSMHLDMERIRNYDKEKVIRCLQDAAERLKDKIIV